MTPAPDTSPEAVEPKQLSPEDLQTALGIVEGHAPYHGQELALHIRALSGELARVRADLSIIRDLSLHHIPFHAYGDSEAACDMANRMSRIAAIASQGPSHE